MLKTDTLGIAVNRKYNNSQLNDYQPMPVSGFFQDIDGLLSGSADAAEKSNEIIDKTQDAYYKNRNYIIAGVVCLGLVIATELITNVQEIYINKKKL